MVTTSRKSVTPWLRGLSALLSVFVLFIPALVFNADVLLHKLTIPSRLATIDWLPSEMHSCADTSCFLEPPMSRVIPKMQALISLNRMRRYLESHTIPIVREIGNQTVPLSVCSVVGGAPTKDNENHGAVIDNSIVYRINIRVPEFLAAESQPTKLGTRTDILVLQFASLRIIGKYIDSVRNRSNPSSIEIARANAGESVKKRKPLLLYRIECPGRRVACSRGWGSLLNSTVPEWLPLSFMNPNHEFEAVKQINRISSGKYELPMDPNSIIPSTGLVTIINALSICRHVNLFAFNGSIAGDRDFPKKTVWFGHSMNEERATVRWLARCSRTESWLCGRLTLYS